MDFFEKMKGSVSVTSQKMSQKAKVTTESLRITNQMKTNDKMVEKLVYQVGKQCVESHLAEENSEYEELFAEIRRLREENQELRQKLQSLSAVNICPGCGFGNEQGTKFCKNCGSPLSESPELQTGARCESCGAVNPEDSIFCYNCGNKLM